MTDIISKLKASIDYVDADFTRRPSQTRIGIETENARLMPILTALIHVVEIQQKSLEKSTMWLNSYEVKRALETTTRPDKELLSSYMQGLLPVQIAQTQALTETKAILEKAAE